MSDDLADDLARESLLSWDAGVQPADVSHPVRRVGARWSRALLVSLTAIAIMYLGLSVFRIYVRRYYLFLPDYVRWTLTPATSPRSGPAAALAATGPKHLFVIFVDHWEPDYDLDRARRWAARYSSLAARHRDGDGRPPQHTWFYPGEQRAPEIMGLLRELTVAGLGEVELHFHHGDDTADTLTPKLRKAIEEFQQFGFLETVSGETRFAFVHGNFGLDNSNGPHACGVDTELTILHDLGSFADFSFPSVYRRSQPDIVNAIYAAKDDPAPKSYERRLPLAALTSGDADLMIFEGPLVFSPSLHPRRLFLDLDDGNIHAAMPASPMRIGRWLRANVHVAERPDWIFIKLWAHGVSTRRDEEAVVGPGFDELLTAFEQHYNDRAQYVLHYITAREAYNLAMAAAQGVTGPPEQYLDSVVGPYISSARRPAVKPRGSH